MRKKFKLKHLIPPSESDNGVVFDGFDNTKNFKHSSVYEKDDVTKLICMRKGPSVLDIIVFDVADVFALLGKLDSKINGGSCWYPEHFLKKNCCSVGVPITYSV